ncbi:ABC transporter permease [Romboutsia sp.]|uniref:ABC transporter permease n=1 Tax=Romboutsia sp. TaxID=1965302 RepID=UPI002CAB2357|nr:ABC transporter permease [Romboutsia sp.]HSQ88713.1 ABC transporter permease [Romboutsia sp.]
MKKNKKFINYLILIFLVIVMNFLLPKLLPGNPLAYIVGEDIGMLTAQEKAQLISDYNLDKPLYIQFIQYIKNIITLNFGMSFSKKLPIFDVVKSATLWTLLLSTLNIIISTLLGSYLGLKSAMKKKEKSLKMNLFVSSLSCFPLFWISMILLVLFSVKLTIFPSFGAYTVYGDFNIITRLLDVLTHLILPLTAMVITSISSFYIQMRVSVLEVLNEDYIFMAKVKSIPDEVIKKKYILRNSLLPVFTIFMLNIGYIFSGSIVVESVFSYPGLGKIMFDSIIARDYPLIQYCFLTISTMVILSNYIADKLYKYIDPRVVDKV